MTHTRMSPSWKTALTLASFLVPVAPALAAPPPAPPSPGAILQQAAPAPLVPAAPGQAITLPAPAQQKLPANISLRVVQVVISGNSLIPTARLEALMRPVIGKTVPLSTLDATVAGITAAYQAAGYPLAYAYLPPQRIADGVVQVAVVEPRYDQVVVAGHARLRPGMTKYTASITPGAPVAEAALDRSMLLLNQTPGVQVRGELVPGANPATTTLRLIPTDQPVLSGSVSETDYGSRDTGSYLTNASVTASNPFGYGSALSANVITADTGVFHAGSLTAMSPNIWNGVRAGIYVSTAAYKLGDHFKALDELGRATELGADVTAPLLLAPRQTLGLRFDVLDNWLAQSTRSAGTTAQQTIPVERVTLSGLYVDHFNGVTSAALSVSHGDLTLSPGTTKTTDAAGPKAAGGFWVSQLQLQRQQALPLGFSLLTSFSGQLSGQNLDSSQKFYIGGPYGVMSYPVGDGGGDEGYLLTAKLSHRLPVPRLPGVLSGSLLAQTGTVWINHTPYAGASGGNQVSQSGIGVGVDYNVANWTLSAAFSTQLGANSSPLVTTRNNQGWFSLSYAF